MQNKRHLMIIPIIHAPADFGSLGSNARVDPKYETMAIDYWRSVSEYVQQLPFDFSKLTIYQDGLPNVATEIVRKVVDETQTPNYELLRWCRDKGAHIEGTEDLSLLLEEYNALKAIFNAENEEQKNIARLEYVKVSQTLLEGRDEYIAQRIRATLPEGGSGLLFLGLVHEVKHLLEQEVEVSEPEGLIGGSSENLRQKLSGRERRM